MPWAESGGEMKLAGERKRKRERDAKRRRENAPGSCWKRSQSSLDAERVAVGSDRAAAPESARFWLALPSRIMSTKPPVERVHPPNWLMRLVNPVTKRMVERGRGKMADRLVVLRFTGRKTGGAFEIPIGHRVIDGRMAYSPTAGGVTTSRVVSTSW
jgi:hypothetical protein